MKVGVWEVSEMALMGWKARSIAGRDPRPSATLLAINPSRFVSLILLFVTL